MLLILAFAYVYLIGVNLAAFAAVGWDKRCARYAVRRVPESVLLALGALGGWLGLKAGQKLFRHKRRKTAFTSIMKAIPILHLVVAGAAVLGIAATTA